MNKWNYTDMELILIYGINKYLHVEFTCVYILTYNILQLHIYCSTITKL